MLKLLFYLIWLAVLLVGPYAVFTNTPLSVVMENQVLLVNFLQRLVGVIAFSLVFSQVMIGSLMTPLTQKLGGFIYKFHVTEGILTYLLILTHPLLFILFNYKVGSGVDPFYVFTDICVICKPQIEYYYTFGRVAFWFLTIAVGAAYFRTHPLLRLHWFKFHILNFLAFYLIALHAYFVGTDTHGGPFKWFFWGAILTVTGTILYKTLRPLTAKLALQK